MKPILAPMLLCAIMVTPVLADVLADDKGAYAGVTLGHASTGSIGAKALTNSSNNIYGFWGGYQFNGNFAVEATQSNVGKFVYFPNVSAKSEVLSLTAMGMLPVFRNNAIYAKLGLAATKSELSSNALSATGANRIALTYGAGAQYRIMPGIAARVEWDRYTSAINNSDGSHQDYVSSIWTLGATIKF